MLKSELKVQYYVKYEIRRYIKWEANMYFTATAVEQTGKLIQWMPTNSFQKRSHQFVFSAVLVIFSEKRLFFNPELENR